MSSQDARAAVLDPAASPLPRCGRPSTFRSPYAPPWPSLPDPPARPQKVREWRRRREERRLGGQIRGRGGWRRELEEEKGDWRSATGGEGDWPRVSPRVWVLSHATLPLRAVKRRAATRTRAAWTRAAEDRGQRKPTPALIDGAPSQRSVKSFLPDPTVKS